jgi:replicative DNA helicase
MTEETGTLGFTPPHSNEAEQSVLGGLLLENDAWERVGDLLKSEHFYDPEHRAIFQTIETLIVANKPADVITVFERGKHEVGYLNALSASVPSAANARRYAEIVRERWAAREAVRIAGETIAKASNTKADIQDTILSTQEALAAIGAGSTRQEPVFIEDGLLAHLARITARAEGKDEVYPTLLHDLDKLLAGGLRPGRVYVIGARPSMGKTTLGLTIAKNIAEREGLAALFLTMEMPAEQLNDSLIASMGNIPLDKVLQPDPNDDEFWSRLVEGTERVRRLNLLIDEQPALRIIDARSKIITAKRKAEKVGAKLAVCVADYLQLMQGEGDNRSVEIGKIANGWKALAKTLRVPVVLLAQCNREADKKPDGADSMSDLNESGGIEAAADFIGLLHREFVRTSDDRLKHFGQLRVPKNRAGSTGRVNLYFDGAKQFFGSWTGPAPVTGSGIKRSTHAHGSAGMDGS